MTPPTSSTSPAISATPPSTSPLAFLPRDAHGLKEEISEDSLYEAFIDWSLDRGLELYPAQDEATIEIVSGANVILATPTGSGKSLVAVAAHFAALATGKRDRKSTRLNSSHVSISYAVFCL